MQKLKFTIKGSKVHDTGYRVLLVNKALSLGVNNFNTFNTYINSTQAVIAIIEAGDEVIEEFKNFVLTFTPKEAIVEDISFEGYKNTVPPIERVMQAFQMEQWGKGIPILLSMLEKQDKMLEKQDSLIKVTEKGFADMKTGFREVKEEIHLVRDDFREMFMREVSDLRGEIAEIKATLARMQEAG